MLVTKYSQCTDCVCSSFSIYYITYCYPFKPLQWRRKMPKSGGGGGGTHTRDLCTFGKEPI